MRRAFFLCLTVLGACGDGGGDGGTAPVGTWQLVSDTSSSTVDGWLEVTDHEYALGLARPGPSGVVTSFTVSGSSLVLGSGGTIGFTLQSPNMLTLKPDAQRTQVFAKATAQNLATIPLTGTVTYAAGAAEMAHPRAALIFLARSAGEVTFVNDTRDDRPLTFTAGSASIDFSRDREALGTERITFGPVTAGIAIGMVVIYDDRDGTGSDGNDSTRPLDDLFTPCSATTKDCIRGISPIFLGYRDGTSAELTASPYAFLRAGWSHAVVATDTRAGSARVGLLPTDPTKAIVHDVTLPVDPATVAVPGFKL